MRKAGVEGLPQNYALFYQAYIGANEKLPNCIIPVLKMKP